MNTVPDNKILTGTWKDGRVLLDQPADWPEGCRLVVTPQEAQRGQWLGITEEEWPRTSDALADWMKWLDSIEPIELTPDEEAGLFALAAAEDGIAELVDFGKRVEGLFE